MAAGDSFSRMLEHLTEQLRCEHQREVGQLHATIGHLELKLKEAGCFPARLEGDEQGAPDGNTELKLKDARYFPARLEGDDQGAPDGNADLSSGRVVRDVSNCSSVGDGGAARPMVGVSTASASSASAASASTVDKKRIKRMLSHSSKLPRRRSRLKALDFSTGGSRAIRTSAFRREVSYSSFPPLAFIERLVQSTQFEIFFCVLIALNVVIMALEAQNHAYDVGTNYLELTRRFETHIPIGPEVFDMAGYIFGVLFTIEIALRIVGKRCQFVRDPWNVMDFLIVVMWFVSRLQQRISINPQLLRLARMAKILRMARLVKHIQGFDSLFLLTTSLKGSVEILGWTCCMLLAVLMLNGLLLNQILVEFYFKNDAFSRDERREVYRYFGSFTTSLFSMFELTLGNFPPLSRVLYENVTPWFIAFAIIHKITIGFAIISVVNGVFIQETFRTAQLDDELMCRRTHRAFKTHAEKIKRLVTAADTSGEGELDIHEFREIFNDPVLRTWLASMEFAPGDVDALFDLMSHGTGSLTVDDMIAGVAKYKGNARSIDIHHLMTEQRLLKEFIQEQFREPADGCPGHTTTTSTKATVEL